MQPATTPLQRAPHTSSPGLLLQLLSSLRLLSDSHTMQQSTDGTSQGDTHTQQMDAFLAGPGPADRSIITGKSARRNKEGFRLVLFKIKPSLLHSYTVY